MLEKLTVEDFQVHAKTIIEFGRHVTVIVGSTDAGKSSTVRALRWLCLNQFEGNAKAFIRYGAKAAKVTLEIDGYEVTRYQSSSENYYILDGQEFRSFGHTVPDTISRLLKVSDANFQGQHDSIFWFSLSPGEVSRQLNAVVDLGLIDEALAHASKRTRRVSAGLDIGQQRLNEARQAKDSLEWVLQANQDYEQVERLAQKHSEITEDIEDLTGILSTISQLESRRDKALEFAADTKSIGMIARETKQSRARLTDLEHIVESIKSCEYLIGEGTPDFSAVETCFRAYNESMAERQRLEAAIECLETAERRFQNALDKKTRAKESLKNASEGRCPLCGQEWSDDHEHDSEPAAD